MADTTTMAILQEVDKCVRCNGCYIACKRNWNMKDGDAANRGVHRVAPYQRVVIKSMRKTDMGPFMRYSCWHCVNPPCAGRCPFKAIKKEVSGAVSVDFNKCNPADSRCTKQCVTDCQRGGYPKVGIGNYELQNKAFKCTLCHGKAGDGGNLPTKATPYPGGGYYSPVSQGLTHPTNLKGVDQLAHQPTCVMTCPAKAMMYDTRDNIRAYLADKYEHAATVGGRRQYSAIGDGSMYWWSAKYVLAAPKADPFVEDHITPMVSGMLSSPFARAAIVPTLVAGGLLALSARRAENEKTTRLSTEGGGVGL
jgi:Fe-S-cluster-containing dehydrogenase component